MYIFFLFNDSGTNMVNNTYFIRDAVKSDQTQIDELCKFIWEGQDYVPNVFPIWISDKKHNHTMVCVTNNNEIVGIGNIHKTGDQGWIEGIRTHVHYRGQGIAKLLFRQLQHPSFEPELKYIRYMTGIDNTAIHKLAHEYNFQALYQVTEIMFVFDKSSGSKNIPYTKMDPTSEDITKLFSISDYHDQLPLSFFVVPLNPEGIKWFKEKNNFWKVNDMYLVDEYQHIEKTDTSYFFSLITPNPLTIATYTEIENFLNHMASVYKLKEYFLAVMTPFIKNITNYVIESRKELFIMQVFSKKI